MDLLSKTKTVIKSLLISSTKSLTISDLDREFHKFEGHAIPFFSLGYPNLKQFLLSIPDVLTISHSGDIIPVAFNSRVSITRMIKCGSHAFRYSVIGYKMRMRRGRIPSLRIIKTESAKTSYHIHKFVASSASSSATFQRFDDTYRPPRSTPRIKIDYSYRDFDHNRDNGSNNLRSQLEINSQPVPTTQFIRSDSIPLKTIDQPTIVDVQSHREIEQQEAASNRNVDDQSALPFLDEDDPIHFLGPLSNAAVKIPCPTLTEFKAGRTYDVLVTEISRLSNFWFSLCSNAAELNMMEEQLKSNGNDGKSPTMRPFEMVAGNACLVAHKWKVLRAEFLSEPIGDKVKVCFVDYGTVDVVNAADCRRMNKYFAAIPRLCVPGALELDPIKNRVARESVLVERFCKMVQNKPLCGYVTQVDRKNKSVRMVLIDTSDDKEDVIVNRELLAF